MEKVIITKEQEVALQIFKGLGKGIEFFVRNRGTWSSNYKCLNDVAPNDFALMYAGFYEVEDDKFKPGDWVFSEKTRKYYEVVSDEKWYRSDTLYQFYVNKESSRFVKVTDEWRLALLNKGRTNGEFVKGDVIVTSAYAYEVGNNNKFAMEDALNGNIVRFFLKENAVTV